MRGFFVFMALVASFGFDAPARAQPAEELKVIQQRLLKGELEDALKDINAYLRAHPGDPPARFLKGLILKSAKLNAEAIEVYESLVEDLPAHPEPLNNLAVLYAEQGDYQRATDALKRLVQDVDPTYAAAYENLGDVYAAWASDMYDRAAQLNSKSNNLERKRAYLGRFTRPRQASTPAQHAPGNRPSRVAMHDQSALPERSAAKPADVEDTITETVSRWARAWSSQDVDRYLSFYADDYVADGFADRAAWAESRRLKITRPRRIQVDVQELRIEIDKGRARARLLQVYRSDTYQDRTYKTLTFEDTGGQWRIVEETSLPAGESTRISSPGIPQTLQD